MDYICPVCGYDGLEESAYNEYDLPSFEICSCCRFQFGDDDDVEVREGVFLSREEAHSVHREKWIKDGVEIFQPEYYPAEFQVNDRVIKQHLIQQLKNINIDIT
ncbi:MULTISPECIES: hypothetical protein [unclassified Exiguobacterium]|uniref:hypothetical protein n=1 Tax=unclassified Exiguobacterium TaxID=2644629 RepID=UPI001BE7B407|nr:MULTISPECIES: hypothetical protein [unclassified Exiguobacterium]